MATFVLVPGFWLGGWAWRDVADHLIDARHRVYPVTLTGLGDRVHLATPDTDLDTHIADVVNVLKYENLTDVILAGHSYAGNVIVGVADRIPERIKRLVYVDTFPLADGVAQAEFNSPEGREEQRNIVDTHGDGWRLPMPSWEDLDQGNDIVGLGDSERTRMRERAVDQPYGTVTQPLKLTNPARESIPKTVICCSMTEAESREMLTSNPQLFGPDADCGVDFVELPTGHWPMFSRPADLANLLGRQM